MNRVIRKSSSRRGMSVFLNRLANDRIERLSRRHYSARGHKLAIFANDSIGISINTYGTYEKEELTAVFDFLSPLSDYFRNGVAFDVGANIGNHTLYFANIFRSVHAFEPNPDTFALLKFNVQWAKNCVVHNFGLGEHKGQVRLIEDPTNLGASHIAQTDYSGDDALPISLERLDELNVATSRLCFMKIDVEGFEASVLKGGLITIRDAQPIVAFEQIKESFVNGSSDAVEILRDLGYVFCWHQSGIASKIRFFRRLANCLELFGGRRCNYIISGPTIPQGYYSMIIGVPPRFRVALGLT